MNAVRSAAVTACLLLLAGCATPLQRLKDANPPANDFHSSLAAEYLGYADSESEQGRRLTAQHYAHKGLKALNGEPVELERPDTSLTPDQQEQLAAARVKIVSLLNDDMKRVAPQKLAHAQLLFDCWQHQLSKDLNQEKAPCAEEFTSTIGELQEVSDFFHYNVKSSHELSFASGSAKLSGQAHARLKSIARSVAKTTDYIVEIEAQEDADKALAAERVSAISKALNKAGVDAAHIRVKTQNDSKTVYLEGERPKGKTTRVIIAVKTHHEDKKS